MQGFSCNGHQKPMGTLPPIQHKRGRHSRTPTFRTVATCFVFLEIVFRVRGRGGGTRRKERKGSTFATSVSNTGCVYYGDSCRSFNKCGIRNKLFQLLLVVFPLSMFVFAPSTTPFRVSSNLLYTWRLIKFIIKIHHYNLALN